MTSLSVSVSGMKTLLPADFSPRPQDVIVGRQGKSTKAHNQHFQNMINNVAEEYSNAVNKANKSRILLTVIHRIQQKGAFIRRELQTDRWYTVEDSVARSTAAQMMRDALHSNYRSSRQFKQQRRLKQEATIISSSSSFSEPVPMMAKMSGASSSSGQQPGVTFTVLQAATLHPLVEQRLQIQHQQQQPRMFSSGSSAAAVECLNFPAADSFIFPSSSSAEDSLNFPSLLSEASLDFPSLFGDGGSPSLANTINDSSSGFGGGDCSLLEFSNFDNLNTSIQNILQSATSGADADAVQLPLPAPIPDESNSNLFSLLSTAFGNSSSNNQRDIQQKNAMIHYHQIEQEDDVDEEDPFEPTPVSSILEDEHLANGLDELISCGV